MTRNADSDSTPASSALSRRTVVRGVAWTAPVISVAVAAPAYAVSGEPVYSLAWTGSSTALQTFELLDTGGTRTSSVPVTVPTLLTLTNGAGTPQNGRTAVFQISVGRPQLNPPVGRARGFGVASFRGVSSTAIQRTAVYQSGQVVGLYGFPATTFTTTTTVSVGADGELQLPVVFGLAGVSTGVSVTQLVQFPVSAIVTIGGQSWNASAVITVPVGAGIL